MGKPYQSELASLPETYRWAMAQPIDSLAAAVARTAQASLLAVGSGGSFTAAHFASALHQRLAGRVSKPLTPLEFVRAEFDPGATAVLTLSAGGTNADIIGCFKDAVRREPSGCMILCLRKQSRIARLAERFGFVDVIDWQPPAGQDGFLSTNSLLAFVVLLSRGYAAAFSMKHGLPGSLADLLAQQGLAGGDRALREICQPLWERDHLVVLFSPDLQAAAIDIESKFSEAALGSVQVVDFRNFAHGRHNWMAKRGQSTAVLALITKQDEELASRTLQLLPKKIPIARIRTTGASVANSIAAVLAGLHIVGFAGQARQIDPGRPGVPAFGRRIYNLRCLMPSAAKGHPCTPACVAIARKLRWQTRCLESSSIGLASWQKMYQSFVGSFDRATFQGIVFDYDGTLCEVRARLVGIGKTMGAVLASLLANGIALGIVTGRGKSVRRDLQKQIPKEYWTKVLVGYYNGSIISRLSDDDLPEKAARPSALIESLAAAVADHPVLGKLTALEPRHNQISLQPLVPGLAKAIWEISQQFLPSFAGVRAVISSHSVDLLGPGVTKTALVDRLTEQLASERLGSEANILCIGDKGAWPGNDFELLSGPYSLSAGEVSTDPKSCWNLAPSGHRGPQAVLDYLRALRVLRTGGRLDIAKIGRGRAAPEE